MICLIDTRQRGRATRTSAQGCSCTAELSPMATKSHKPQPKALLFDVSPDPPPQLLNIIILTRFSAQSLIGAKQSSNTSNGAPSKPSPPAPLPSLPQSESKAQKSTGPPSLKNGAAPTTISHAMKPSAKTVVNL